MGISLDLLQDDISPSVLWAALNEDVRREAADAVYRGGPDASAWRQEADAAVAAAIRIRPTAIRGLPPEVVPQVVPERAFAYEQLGKWYRTRGESRLAIDAFWKAFELSGGRASTANLVRQYQQLDQEEEGRREFAERGATWPD